MDTYPKLPKRQLFTTEPSSQIKFTDIILSPFLLVSSKVVEVIKIYREHCFYREVIILDQVSGQSEMYYLPVFDETNSLQIVYKKYEDGIEILNPERPAGEPVVVDKNIFWVRNCGKRHTIISLNLAESLLRRDISGIGLVETELIAVD